ncbi:hypothetical protein [Flaviaesturariibacter amylovorans]|uniref:Glycosyltransferase RgtA/B/C/D-like domain-containing protein n=1 Tax=Flaviaesturariibacter amylovorans TaxID=1084520 RepID=A0ABP8GGG2_9BACT
MPNDGRTFSRNCFLIASLWLLAVGFCYYPKWTKPQTEATLSWDVSGYYLYLPAAFIYKDFRQQAFKDSIMRRYVPASDAYQSYRDSASGNMVMKYSMGMSLAYLPFFAAGHVVAHLSGHPADGFSPPYQAAIGIGSLLVSLLGLHFLRRLLDRYVSSTATGIVLLLYVFGTHYLEYAAITNAMSHSYLFTCYAGLLLLTIRYYEEPSRWRAAGIGALVGWMTLIRPTELLALLLVLGWGIGSGAALKARLQLLARHRGHLLLAAAGLVLVGGLQPLYWKLVAGRWLVFSYTTDHFDFGAPHFSNALWSFRKGWWIYTPLMFLSVVGFAFLYRRPALFWPVLLFVLPFFYVTFSWSNWWYGGGLGQRALIQVYPVLAFPLAALIETVYRRRVRWLLLPVVLFCTYYNLWLHHQAHRGGLLEPEFMTYAYWKKIFLRYEVAPDARKLLDADEEYAGVPACPELVFQSADTMLLTAQVPYTPAVRVAPLEPKRWVRAEAVVWSADPERYLWTMSQLVVREWKGGQVIKQNQLRAERLLEYGFGPKKVWLDLELRDPRDSAEVFFYNTGSAKQLNITGLKVYRF